MSRKLSLAEGETSRTACARTLAHRGVDEKTGEVLTAATLAERVGWCIGLTAGMVDSLLGEHWNTADVDTLASGVDAGGRSCRRTHGWRCAVWAGLSTVMRRSTTG